MLVTVTVTTYNSARFVEETLESVKNQTYRDIELIVGDDCSTDNTIELCTNWIEKNKDRFVRTQIITTPVNTGIPANKNRGIRAATGQWIKSIAGDDTLVPDCIERFMDYLKLHPDILVLHSNAYDYTDNFSPENRMPVKSGAGYKINQPGISAEEQFQILLRINRVRAGTSIMNKRVFELAGYYDESIRLWEDRPMWLQLTSHGIKLHFLDVYSQNYRHHTSSVVRHRVANRKIPGISNHKIYTITEFNKRFLKFLPIQDRTLKLASDKLLMIAHRYNNSTIHNPLINKIVMKMVGLSQKLRNKYQAPYR